MPQILIIADDLTGAADAGATFAHAGWPTVVALRLAAELPVSDVLVASTESRGLAREEAVARVQLVARRLQGTGLLRKTIYVYKKIDSTLRGYPGPELAAAMGVFGLKRVLVAPAFPAQGRTTVGGRQLVDGVPVERSVFGREVPCSELSILFQPERKGKPPRLIGLESVRRGTDAVRAALDASNTGLVIADAETDADLKVIAQGAVRCGVDLWCGSAGLAQALAQVLPRPESKIPRPAVPPPPRGAILAVAGSRQPRTARQVEVAQDWGVAVVYPALGLPEGEAASPERTIQRTARRLADGEHVILTTAGLDDAPRGEQAMASRLASVVRELAAGSWLGGLVLTGGDIAAAACAALEADALWLHGETQPGIAWGVLLGGLLPGLPVVTKAGGFGTDETLVVAIRMLQDWKAEGLVSR
jgi:uncharacterized protein YgbK (DUF1537 family)